MDFSDEMVDEIFKIFQVESEEIISKINNSLLDLEKKPDNKDAILMLFRDAHTLKGASRMVGFNTVQNLAHKMEDVLGLAKDNKILINSKVVDILYKTVDFLSELIQKSLQKGQEIYSEDVSKHISILDNIEEYADFGNKPDEQAGFNKELFILNINKINSLLPECLFILMRIEIQKDLTLIEKLFSVTKDLYDIFKEIGPFNIKNLLEDIKFKLEFTMKASNSLTTGEIEEIQQILNNVINKLASICELYNFEFIDYYSIAFEKIAEISKEYSEDKTEQSIEVIPQELITEEIPSTQIELENTLIQEQKIESDLNLAIIKEKIANLIQNVGSISEIKKLLIKFEKECNIDDAKNTLQKIIEILDFASKNGIQFNEETISVLSQSIEYCDNTIKNQGEIADNQLILQRLEIIQQILELDKSKTDIEVFTSPMESRLKKAPDFSEIFDTGAIKTLRVEASKLDILINQLNELTIAKIKTKKHLSELNTINRDIEDWQKNLLRILNYLKYYDKKNIQSGFSDDSMPFLVKQFLNLLSENHKDVLKISSNINTLHRAIQEDDMKMGHIVDNLNSMVKNIRVLPLATVFHLFGRMVRDIAQEKNKKIDFEIIGSETSTDKKIIEEIKTPLIHIIRNAIDHGIETPEERTALGKPPEGKIILLARQVNNKVIIEIKDDGRGINLAKLKEKAIQKGFLTPEELKNMSDEQITNIIFAPGFSTGDEITNISGRGIGLDVVQSKISQLNGKVKIISELNKGCCVQIELPTTMSIVNVLLVEVSRQTFAIPMEVINTVLRKRSDEIIISNNRKSIVFNEETISLYNLSDILNLPNYSLEKDAKKTILIMESDNKIIALTVDKLIGEQEILHKKLSAPFYKLKNISGITTLISGQICLILNIQDLLNTASRLKSGSNLITENKLQNNSQFKILLVDDSATTRVLEKNILKKEGYTIELAENPIEALEKMQNTRFDLIISDVEMPEMNGLDFLKKLKTDEMFFDIPFIIVSSLTNEENKKRATELGAKKYIIKGEFDQKELLQTVREIFKEDSN